MTLYLKCSIFCEWANHLSSLKTQVSVKNVKSRDNDNTVPACLKGLGGRSNEIEEGALKTTECMYAQVYGLVLMVSEELSA